MWDFEATPVSHGRKYRLLSGGQPCCFDRFFALLQSEDAFADWYSATLAAYPADAFYWELPPLTIAAKACPTEFVLIDAPALAGLEPDPVPFASYFPKDGGDISVFPNLGRDATMIVPSPRGPAEVYPHFATFVRNGPREQIRRLWRRTARELQACLSEKPVWLSTAGGGVAWLHLRIDTRPKYYSHRPYRDPGVFTAQ